MVNKPNPANYGTFRQYANAVRQWYINKPVQWNTNTVNTFTNALQNYFRTRGGPSNTNVVIARELQKLFEEHNRLSKLRWTLPPPNNLNNILKALVRIENKLRKNAVKNDFLEARNELKNKLRRQITNERALKLVSSRPPSENNNRRGTNLRMKVMQLGPVVNALQRAMKTIWTNTGKKKFLKEGRWIHHPAILRKPNGSTVYMNTRGVYHNFPNSNNMSYMNNKNKLWLKNLTTWRNTNGTIWVWVNGAWHKFSLKKPGNK
jgi:hypothetical protein